nr:zinc-ribbon domain-containing protein [Phycisphaerae bacterium]NIR52200.1 zinc-ribbon domain-containing protein [candidate division KSB1 bacterium]NIV02387.1 zinc-ribbon domain-containing protein [Phycisphaerae bacterium]NIV70588.1 zinc-ribbon domain-containing protein [Phycisphaerae bacterium]NIX32576.1 zinc-ribbon domain-containing protein [Phycisphaerae bacterium]
MKTTLQCPKCQETLKLNESSCANCGQEFCPECYYPIDFDAENCPNCGATFDVFCPRCENEIDPAAVFCRHCGLVFEENNPVLVPEYLKVGTSDDGEETKEEDDFNGICPVCQAPLYIEDGYCAECETTLCTNCG